MAAKDYTKMSLAELQAARAKAAAEVKRRGGDKKAPNYASRVSELDKAITSAQGTTGTTGTAGTTTDTNAAGAAAQPSVDQRVKEMIARGQDFGQGIADRYFSDGSLGRVNEDISPEMRAVMDKTNEIAAHAGERSTETQGSLDNLKALAAQHGFTSLEEEAIANGRNALSGITPQQMESLRSIAAEQNNRDTATRLRQLETAASRSGLTGGAGLAARQGAAEDLQRTGAWNNRLTTRDLLAKQVDEQRMARESFNTLTGNFENNRSTREQNAASLYANTLGNTTNQEFGQKATANQMQSGNQQFADVYKRQGSQFNLDQAGKEKSGQASSLLGGVSAISGLEGSLRGEDFAAKGAQDAKDQLAADRVFQQQMIDKQQAMMADLYKHFQI